MQPHILIVGTNMMNIFHHRLELIRDLLEKNYKVTVVAPRGGEEKELEKIGCNFIDTPVDNRGTNIKNDLALLRNLKKIFKREKPDIILTFYTKTNIYGGLVARYLKIPYVENITGLGTSLAGKGIFFRVMSILYREAIKKSHIVFFQNESNHNFFDEHKLYGGRYGMLPGSGVSLERYKLLPYPTNKPTEFLFISRIIKEKGIEEYIKAAAAIKKKYPEVKFHIAGPCEPQCEELIQSAINEGNIIYHGKIYNATDILKDIHCTVLPSYYPEGVANVLLESAASGRPLITTGLPGCKETVDNEITGYIIKEKDVESLAAAMEKFILLENVDKEKMGKAGREKMEKEFDRKVVTKEYNDVIDEILSKKKR